MGTELRVRVIRYGDRVESKSDQVRFAAGFLFVCSQLSEAV